MSWRLDLTNYEDVKDNSDRILYLIQTKQMPPANYPPLTDAQVNLFQEWITDGCPE